jgi:hypothetical protein
MAREYPLTFYNLDNNRPTDQTDREIRALLDPRPAILGLCETTGADLPGVEDYRLIRDRSKPGRDNLAAYVKTNLEVDGVEWWDLEQTWGKTNPGASGQHWPRSILEFRAGRLKVSIAHAPPKGTDNVERSQGEHVDKLAARMCPWKGDNFTGDEDDARAQARVILWDANRKPGEGDNGPDTLTRECGATNAGAKIDLATYRGGEVEGHRQVAYFSSVAGVALQSDHGHAFRFVLDLVAS